jgi:DNA-binding HxlR family transcriptional regulator
VYYTFEIPHNFSYGVSLPIKTRFLFGKGVIETILYIEKFGKAGYYELYKQGFIISRQAFSNLLKTLEENGITNRKVIENRPPRVEYTLTKKGKQTAALIKQLNEII